MEYIDLTAGATRIWRLDYKPAWDRVKSKCKKYYIRFFILPTKFSEIIAIIFIGVENWPRIQSEDKNPIQTTHSRKYNLWNLPYVYSFFHTEPNRFNFSPSQIYIFIFQRFLIFLHHPFSADVTAHWNFINLLADRRQVWQIVKKTHNKARCFCTIIIQPMIVEI